MSAPWRLANRRDTSSKGGRRDTGALTSGNSEAALLKVEDLRVSFGQGHELVSAVRGIDFEVGPGESVGIVGESGSGKTSVALAIVRLLASHAIVSGAITFRDRPLLDLPDNELREVRGRDVGMMFQDPMTALNPVMRIGDQIAEPIVAHGLAGWKVARRRAVELLDLVGIPSPRDRAAQYPHQFSGGMRQRVMAAMAVACEPSLLIADEPTTALDVTVQAQILELLSRMRHELRMAILLITHNLGVVAGFSERVLVMYGGTLVESGSVRSVLTRPAHPYTRGLLRSMPRLDQPAGLRAIPIPSGVVSGIPAVGCPFHPRCDFRSERCIAERPQLTSTSQASLVACWAAMEGRLPLEWSPTNGVQTPSPLLAPPSGAQAAKGGAVLVVDGLVVKYSGTGTWLPWTTRPIRAVDGVSFDVKRGTTFALVGESGCGKSSLARAAVALEPLSRGWVTFAGQDLGLLRSDQLRATRRRIQMVFQNSYESFDPRRSIAHNLIEPLRVHGIGSARDRRERVSELLTKVGLDQRQGSRLPHELSGGQIQRAGIARALALKPEFIVCDEPFSALDMSVQGQIVNLLQDLQADMQLTYLVIAHDLSIVRHMADWIAVMYLGKIVEIGRKAEVFESPQHPYTRVLLSSVPLPNPDLERGRRRIILSGELPSPSNPPSGCRFRTRCPFATELCAALEPALETSSGTSHAIACHHWKQIDKSVFWPGERTPRTQDV